MPEEHNALAELANELNRLSIVSGHCPVHSEIIGKASRIVAELANVPFVYNIYGARIAMVCDSALAVERCRAIAEE